MVTREAKKEIFMREIAKFLVENQAGKSIALQMEFERPKGDPRPSLAKEWAKLRGAADLHGTPTEEDALQTLRKLLS